MLRSNPLDNVDYHSPWIYYIIHRNISLNSRSLPQRMNELRYGPKCNFIITYSTTLHSINVTDIFSLSKWKTTHIPVSYTLKKILHGSYTCLCNIREGIFRSHCVGGLSGYRFLEGAMLGSWLLLSGSFLLPLKNHSNYVTAFNIFFLSKI